MGQIRPLFVLFSFFSRVKYSTNNIKCKKCRWYAWDSNPGRKYVTANHEPWIFCQRADSIDKHFANFYRRQIYSQKFFNGWPQNWIRPSDEMMKDILAFDANRSKLGESNLTFIAFSLFCVRHWLVKNECRVINQKPSSMCPIFVCDHELNLSILLLMCRLFKTWQEPLTWCRFAKTINSVSLYGQHKYKIFTYF